jgi:hypothetical protein
MTSQIEPLFEFLHTIDTNTYIPLKILNEVNRSKNTRTVHFSFPQPQALMQTCSKSLFLMGANRVVTTREGTEEGTKPGFRFKSAASAWRKEELRRLGVKFYSAPNQRVEDLSQHMGWDTSSWSEGLKKRSLYLRDVD